MKLKLQQVHPVLQSSSALSPQAPSPPSPPIEHFKSAVRISICSRSKNISHRKCNGCIPAPPPPTHTHTHTPPPPPPLLPTNTAATPNMKWLNITCLETLNECAVHYSVNPFHAKDYGAPDTSYPRRVCQTDHADRKRSFSALNCLPSDTCHIQSSHAWKVALKTRLYKQQHQRGFQILSSYFAPPPPPTTTTTPYSPSLLVTFLLCARDLNL